MYRIGIDVGSTYTKYCIMNACKIMDLYTEPTPVRQKQYFEKQCASLEKQYPGVVMVSCGYGKKNIRAVKNMNELTALSRGSYYAAPDINLVLDIGGQDTKIVWQEHGRLKKFFINDKCAAGSGMFLQNILKLLEKNIDEIDLTGKGRPEIHLSSVCAVFAQSEIVELIADNQQEDAIIDAVIWHILVKAKQLLGKVEYSPVLLSGGITQIKGFREFAETALERECQISKYSAYLSALGCAWEEL